MLEKFHRTDLHVVICSHSRERKTPSYSLIHTALAKMVLMKGGKGKKKI